MKITFYGTRDYDHLYFDVLAADPDNSRQIIQLGPVSNSMASTLYSYAVNEMKVSYRSWYI